MSELSIWSIWWIVAGRFDSICSESLCNWTTFRQFLERISASDPDCQINGQQRKSG